MGFSWAETKQDAIKKKIDRAKILASKNSELSNDDFKIAHPDWIQAAQGSTNKFTQLTSDIKKQTEKQQAKAMIRRAKRAGYN